MRSRYAWMLLLLATTACRTQPSTQKLTEELKTVNSWATTANMVSLAWLQNRVPQVYTKQTLHKTQETLHQELDTIAKVAPSQNRATAIHQVTQLEQIVQQMETQVDQQNRAALTRTLQDLSNQVQGLQSLVQQSGEQL
ncbi:hypothetical protein [Leptolyngbya sp. GGD]|uniref:hypothetical protein n=1 Tax=Leptolyngbya sp. GGD TaxID=2997907 RepID=UPI00227B43EF|nr:hypothetical protein [Leptolyngbya sp. GGD]MCY6488900.1 hypothetical protein [Leptolyngbya sp. GGD]